ncbi:unnamed protein product [Arabis nemorensis]|uniref:Jacalin-type lectin domain-containing protein n=1 Tax=Arabis nemorensis TaxID=586526 RepID=A0A565B8D2_9BRAS|nr:unnamed protein product [Arabis nemorensis]
MSRKVGPYGGDNGNEWDDGVYDGLRKVYVGEDGDRVSYVEFEYVKGDQSITLSHGIGTKLSLEAKGFDKLVGFRGMSSHDRLNALGAHFAVALAPPLEKLKAKGGKIGKEWDDGIHDNVCKITVTYEGHCVYLVQFKYLNGTTIVTGEAHGKFSPLPTSKTEKIRKPSPTLSII